MGRGRRDDGVGAGEGQGSGVVVGRRPALEAVRAGAASEVLVSNTARSTEGLRELLEAASAAGVPVRRVPEEAVERRAAGTRHQGVAVRIARAPELSEGDLEHRGWGSEALVLVLDGVTDPQNVGAAARVAEAAGAEALVVRRHRSGGVTAAAVRASAGALLHLPLARVANIARALGRLRRAGFWVVGLEGGAGRSVLEMDPPNGPLAVVAGSEGSGLSRLVIEACDELASIPMRGRVGSLNVSAAAAVAMFTLAARRGDLADGGS